MLAATALATTVAKGVIAKTSAIAETVAANSDMSIQATALKQVHDVDPEQYIEGVGSINLLIRSHLVNTGCQTNGPRTDNSANKQQKTAPSVSQLAKYKALC